MHEETQQEQMDRLDVWVKMLIYYHGQEFNKLNGEWALMSVPSNLASPLDMACEGSAPRKAKVLVRESEVK